MQQNIVLQSEALELAINLESSPVGDTGAGMMQIQLQLANLMLQLHDIKKEKISKRKCGVPDAEQRDTIRITS